jgi:hypothetical protein
MGSPQAYAATWFARTAHLFLFTKVRRGGLLLKVARPFLAPDAYPSSLRASQKLKVLKPAPQATPIGARSLRKAPAAAPPPMSTAYSASATPLARHQAALFRLLFTLLIDTHAAIL